MKTNALLFFMLLLFLSATTFGNNFFPKQKKSVHPYKGERMTKKMYENFSGTYYFGNQLDTFYIKRDTNSNFFISSQSWLFNYEDGFFETQTPCAFLKQNVRHEREFYSDKIYIREEGVCYYLKVYIIDAEHIKITTYIFKLPKKKRFAE